MGQKRVLTFSSDGRWRKQICGKVYYFGRGKSKSDTKSYREAERAYLRLMEEREAKQPVEIPTRDLSLSDAVEKYLQHLEERHSRGEVSAPYAGRAISNGNLFVEALGPDTQLGSLSELELEQYRNAVLRLPPSEHTGQAISPSTAKTRLDFVKAFYRWAYRMHLIEQMPRNLDDFTRIEIETPRVKVFSMDEIQRLWTAAPDRTRAFIALGLNCGYGQKDVSDLRVGEIDLREGVIERQRSKTRVPSRHKLWPVTMELLAPQLSSEATSTDRVFVGEHGRPLVHEALVEGALKRSDAVKSAFWRIQQKTGINGGRGFYTLRKTAASELEAIDPLVTSMFLAHSPREMKRHYAMRNWAALDEATDRLGERMALVRTPADAPE